MKVSASLVTFRIDINFENCDVDVVYEEARDAGFQGMIPTILVDGAKRHKIDQNSITPIGGTVDFAVHWLAGYVDRNEMCTTDSKWTDYSQPRGDNGRWETKTELEMLGVSVTAWSSFMMGCAHIECEVEIEKFSPELIAKANAVVEEVMKKLVKYYKTKATKKVA